MSDAFTLSVPGGELPVQLFVPDSGSGPGLVLCQEIFGVTPYIRRRAQDLADAGYVVAVPEVYWRLHQEPIDERADDALEQGMAAVQRLDWDAAVGDVCETMRWLAEAPACTGAVGLIGFCFGGGLAYAAAARQEPVCLVSYYGSALPELVDQVPVVQAASLHHFGEADSFIPHEAQEHVREVAEQANDVTWRTWPDADHAFDNPDFALHSQAASDAAWQVTLAWLAARLPVADQPR